MTHKELRRLLRSYVKPGFRPRVMACIEDYTAGRVHAAVKRTTRKERERATKIAEAEDDAAPDYEGCSGYAIAQKIREG